MILKIALFRSRYIQLRPVLYPTIIGPSFPSKCEIFCRKPILKTYKNERKQQARYLFVLLPTKNDIWMWSCILSSWENGIPLNDLFILGRGLFQFPKREHVLKRTEVITVKKTYRGSLLVILARFLKIYRSSKGTFLEDYKI